MPHLIADMPVKALIIKDGRVLIVKDRRWELPGGRVNIGEMLEEALRREIAEELGVDIKIQGLQDVFLRSESDPAHLIVVYRCELTDDQDFQVDPKEVQEIRWISSNDDLSTIDFYSGYDEVLKKYFEQ